MAYRILSLDGGGSWAIIQVMALRDIYGDSATGHDVLKEFDLAIANSGGSIVLAGLMLNMPLAQIYDLFMEKRHREAMFAKRLIGIIGKIIPIVPKYSTAQKKIGLLAAMGQGGTRKLADFSGAGLLPNSPNGQPVKCAIASFSYDQLRAEFFRTYKSATGADPSAIPLVDAVNASTDAPIKYFDKPAVCGGKLYWDGAMAGYNNPIMAGVVEALATDQPPPDSICILSIGTGTVRLAPHDAKPNPPPELAAGQVKPGLFTDLKVAASTVLDDPPDAATYSTHIMLGYPAATLGKIVRMNPVIQPILTANGWTRPPGLTEKGVFHALAELDMDAVDQNDVDLIVKLAKAWMADQVPNQPIRFKSADLSCALGDPLFSVAAAHWKSL